jgi:hypothetical protein
MLKKLSQSGPAVRIWQHTQHIYTKHSVLLSVFLSIFAEDTPHPATRNSNQIINLVFLAET